MIADYSKMTPLQLVDRSEKLFQKFEDSGRKLGWLAKHCDVRKATVTRWKQIGAPVYIMHLLDGILKES